MRCALVVCALWSVGARAQAVELWPYPSSIVPPSAWTGNASLSPGFTISSSSTPLPDPLPAAVERYYDALFFAGAPTLPAGASITALTVTVAAEVPLTLGVDESYELTMPAGGVATLVAPTQWGALRGLETFSQVRVVRGAAVGRGLRAAAGWPAQHCHAPDGCKMLALKLLSHAVALFARFVAAESLWGHP